MIAVIAGKGWLPIEACLQLIKQEKLFFVLSLFEQTTKELQGYLPAHVEVLTQTHYKLGHIRAVLQSSGAQQVLFIGKVEKKDIFNRLKFDWYALKLLASTLNKSDASLMEQCIAELKKYNISVLSQGDVLKHLYVEPGVLTGKLSVELEKDIALGMKAAQVLSAQGVGQTVVVKEGVIIAVEAVEGTNSCITRGIELGHQRVVICKTANQQHNKKYDIPTLGSGTLEGIIKGEVAVIAWQAQQAFIADLDIFIQRAQELGITLVAL